MKREEFTYQTNTGEFVAEKLLPCPFCGGEPEFVTIGNDYTKSRKAEIKCTKCFCKRTTGAIHNNLEWCGRKAIELWNKRTADLSLPPAEGARRVQWSGYGELGNISQKPLQPTAEGAEKLKEMEELFNLEQQLDIPMKDRFHNSAKGKELFAAIQNKPHPTAEGAEEIIESIVESLGEPINIHNHIFEIRPYTVEHKTEWWIFHKEVGSGEPLAQWLQNFATLHAQRIADKMVEEKMRRALINLLRDEQVADTYGVIGIEDIVDEYLKTRDSHESV